jgi:hypothetical protein
MPKTHQDFRQPAINQWTEPNLTMTLTLSNHEQSRSPRQGFDKVGLNFHSPFIFHLLFAEKQTPFCLR